MGHYAECNCVGPDNAADEGWEIEDVDGTLYGVRQQE